MYPLVQHCAAISAIAELLLTIDTSVNGQHHELRYFKYAVRCY